MAPLIAASVVFALWNTAYQVRRRRPAGRRGAVRHAAHRGRRPHRAFALVKGRQRLTRRQLRRIALAWARSTRPLSYAAIGVGVGLSHIDATVSAMLDGTEACFVVAFGALIARRAPGSRAVLGVLISAAGVTTPRRRALLLGIGPWGLLVLGGVACADSATCSPSACSATTWTRSP